MKITVDATFTAQGGKSQTLPAFWCQDYARSLNEKQIEVLAPVGAPGWRVRWTPLIEGRASLEIGSRSGRPNYNK